MNMRKGIRTKKKALPVRATPFEVQVWKED
jgi:hypothetical protein